jgi:hypothetical protein
VPRRTSPPRRSNRSVATTTQRAKHFAYSEIARDVQPFAQKYSSFRNSEFMIKRRRPALTKEALRHRHETWCGMRWTLLVRQANAPRRTVKPCGPDPPMPGSSLPMDKSARRRGLTSPVPRGERGVSRKAIAQGVPDRFGLPDYLVCTLPLSAHKPAGALSARHSLRPLSSGGTPNGITRTRNRAAGCEGSFAIVGWVSERRSSKSEGGSVTHRFHIRGKRGGGLRLIAPLVELPPTWPG